MSVVPVSFSHIRRKKNTARHTRNSLVYKHYLAIEAFPNFATPSCTFCHLLAFFEVLLYCYTLIVFLQIVFDIWLLAVACAFLALSRGHESGGEKGTDHKRKPKTRSENEKQKKAQRGNDYKQGGKEKAGKERFHKHLDQKIDLPHRS